ALFTRLSEYLACRQRLSSARCDDANLAGFDLGVGLGFSFVHDWHDKVPTFPFHFAQNAFLAFLRKNVSRRQWITALGDDDQALALRHIFEERIPRNEQYDQ